MPRKKEKSPPSRTTAESLPPSVQEDPQRLEEDAKALGENPPPSPEDAPKRRGRPPGSKNRVKEEEQAFDYPIEALAILHQGLWNAIAQGLRSEAVLSDDGAREMATWANLCLKQYLSPVLAEYTPLAGYMMTQLGMLGVVLLHRKKRPVITPPEKATLN